MISSSRPLLIALMLLAPSALSACKPPPAAAPGAGPGTSATTPGSSPTAPASAQLDLCAATREIADAGGRYDFVSIEGAWLSDDPRMFKSAVMVPGAEECTLGTDEVREEGEVWCTMHVPSEAAAIEGRYRELLAALMPCFPATAWRSAADDRELPGWVFEPNDDASARAERRLERPSGGAMKLILRFTSANNDFDE